MQPKLLSYYHRDEFEYAGASGGYIDKYGYPFCRGRVFSNVEKDHGQYDTEADVFWATGAAMFVRSDVYSRGGANDVQESAYTLATAVAYLRAMLERGLSIEEAAGQIMFGFSMGANFFLQIAKLRALRPLWSQIVEAFGGSKEAQRMHIHARPALFFKTV